MLSLIGGKWTTFRAFSEQSCDAVLALLGGTRRCTTEDMPIGGGRNFPASESARQDFASNLPGASPARARILLERYGTRASDVQAFANSMDDRPLASLPEYSTGEITFLCKTENVRRLADLLLRRTSVTMEGLLSLTAIEETAAIAASTLGWDRKRTTAEIEHAKLELARRSVANVKPEKAA